MNNMEIKELEKRPTSIQNKRVNRVYAQLSLLLAELRKKQIPDEIINKINTEIDQVNLVSDSNKGLRKQIRKSQSSILKIVEKELKLTTKNYYRNLWIALGMSVFGISLGAAFGAIMGNMAFLAIGLPIGMAIGMIVGSRMDKKVFEEGRQIDLEIKY